MTRRAAPTRSTQAARPRSGRGGRWLAAGLGLLVASCAHGPLAADSSQSGASSQSNSSAQSGNSSGQSSASNQASSNQSTASNSSAQGGSSQGSGQSSGASGQSSDQSSGSSQASKSSSDTSNQSSAQSSNGSRDSSASNASSKNSSNATTDGPSAAHSSQIAAGSALLSAAVAGIVLTIYAVQWRHGPGRQAPPLVAPPASTTPPGPPTGAMIHARAWLVANQLQLEQDLALGAGPTLDDLAGLAGIAPARRARFQRLLQRHRAELRAVPDVGLEAAAALMGRVGELVLADPLLRPDGLAVLAAW